MDTTHSYKAGDLVRLTYVDHFGFLGRDFHPRDADLGLVGEVIGIKVYRDEEDPEDLGVACLTCALVGGSRVLELIDYEVEPA
jgi:hypothetical protein